MKGVQIVLKQFEFTSGWTDFPNFIYGPSVFNCQRKIVEITDPLGCVTEMGAAASKGFGSRTQSCGLICLRSL